MKYSELPLIQLVTSDPLVYHRSHCVHRRTQVINNMLTDATVTEKHRDKETKRKNVKP